MLTVMSTRQHSIADYVDMIHRRKAWKNTTGTFRGAGLTPRELAVLVSRNDVRRTMVGSAYLAFALDDPDYVVTYNGVPMLWHSTMRGIKHRKDSSAWEWVSGVWRPTLRHHRYTQWHLHFCEDLTKALNDRLVAARR